MSTQSVGDAVATQNKAEALIQQYSNDFATVLPSHIKSATWIRLAQGALRRNPDLKKAAEKNTGSFLQALLEAARFGLEPGTEEFYLVPFGNEVTGIVGYRGEIELMYRAGAVSSIKAELVYANDEFEFDPAMDRPHHKPDWFGERGDIIGAYAYAVMKDGATSRVCVMSRAQIEQVRAVSPSGKSSASPWNKWWDRMALKTVLHQLAKFVPKSAEYRREQLRAAVEADNLRQPRPGPAPVADPPADSGTGEIHDAEIVDDEPQEASS